MNSTNSHICIVSSEIMRRRVIKFGWFLKNIWANSIIATDLLYSEMHVACELEIRQPAGYRDNLKDNYQCSKTLKNSRIWLYKNRLLMKDKWLDENILSRFELLLFDLNHKNSSTINKTTFQKKFTYKSHVSCICKHQQSQNSDGYSQFYYFYRDI